VNTVVLSLETLLLNSQKKDKNAKRKEEAIEMFEGIALDAAGILVFFFFAMIALIIICGWMFLPRKKKLQRTNTRKLKSKQYSPSENYTIFKALVKTLKEEEKK